jgi:hypothetical protein
MKANGQAVLLINGERTGEPIPCVLNMDVKKGTYAIDRELRFPATKGGVATIRLEWRAGERGGLFLIQDFPARPVVPGDWFTLSP